MTEEPEELYEEIVIPNSDGGEAFRFEDINQLTRYLGDDVNLLDGMKNLNDSKSKQLHSIASSLHHSVSEQRRLKQHILDEKLVPKLSEYFKKCYEYLPRHDAPERQFIREAARIGDNSTAAGVLAYLLRSTGKANVGLLDNSQAGAILGAVAFSEGLFSFTSDAWLELVKRGRDTLDLIAAEHNAVVAKAKDDNDAEHTRLVETRNFYEEVQQFAEPANYWYWKSWKCMGFALFLFIAMIGFGCWAGCHILKEAASVKTDLKELAGTEEFSKLTYLHYAPSVIPIVVMGFGAVWLIRVGLRLAFSQWHVGTDAAERSILITTWLAMDRKENPPRPEERQFMMRQVFRHATLGASEKETIPPNVVTNIQGDGS